MRSDGKAEENCGEDAFRHTQISIRLRVDAAVDCSNSLLPTDAVSPATAARRFQRRASLLRVERSPDRSVAANSRARGNRITRRKGRLEREIEEHLDGDRARLHLKPTRNDGLMAEALNRGMSTEAERDTPAHRAPRIVLVEPDGLVRGLITEWLTSAGYAVRPGYPADGADVEEIDAVIVDLYMPRES